MRFSIYLNPQTHGAHEDVALIEAVRRQAVEATHAGFQGVTLTEHHFSNYNTYGNPFIFAAHLYPQTPKGTVFALSCAVPPLWNPMRLAQESTLLDVLTEGNAIIGFAPGGSPLEYSGVGRNPAIRAEEHLKVIDIVEKVLAKQPEDPPLEWATAVEQGTVHTRLMPAAYNGASLKFGRATQSDEGAAWTGRKGWYLMTAREEPEAVAARLKAYEAGLRETELPEEDVQHRLDWSFVQKQVYVADSVEQALTDVIPMLDELGENQRKAFKPVAGVEGAGDMKTVLRVSANDHDAFIREAIILGDPATVADQIRRYEAAGVRHMTLVFNWGFMTAEQSDRSLRKFIDEVLPQFL